MESYRVQKLDESEPHKLRMEPGTTAISFENRFGNPLDELELSRAIEKQTARTGITSVAIDRTSLLTSTRIARLFPIIRGLYISGQKIEELAELESLPELRGLGVATYRCGLRSLAPVPRLKLATLSVEIARHDDAAYLQMCSGLKSLEIISWRSRNLEELQGVDCEAIRLVGGKLENLSGATIPRLTSTIVQSCDALETLRGWRTDSLWVDHCVHVDLSSLSEVGGLRMVQISRMRAASLKFLQHCPNLRDAIFSAVDVDSPEEILSLGLKHLRKLWLPNADNAIVRRAATLNPDLAISNGRLAFRQKEEITVAAFNEPDAEI